MGPRAAPAGDAFPRRTVALDRLASAVDPNGNLELRFVRRDVPAPTLPANVLPMPTPEEGEVEPTTDGSGSVAA